MSSLSFYSFLLSMSCFRSPLKLISVNKCTVSTLSEKPNYPCSFLNGLLSINYFNPHPDKDNTYMRI